MSLLQSALPAIGLVAAACVHLGPMPGGPEDTARRYASALRVGNLDAAWALSTPLDRDQFAQRYASEEARIRRSIEVDVREGAIVFSGPAELRNTGHGWRVVEPPLPTPDAAEQEEAQMLVEHFLDAIARGDFDAVFGDLSASWRARYTPARLKSDLLLEPVAAERLARIKASLRGQWELTPNGPELPLGAVRRLKLQREGSALKVVALE